MSLKTKDKQGKKIGRNREDRIKNEGRGNDGSLPR